MRLVAQLVPHAEKRVFREWVTTLWVPCGDALCVANYRQIGVLHNSSSFSGAQALTWLTCAMIRISSLSSSSPQPTKHDRKCCTLIQAICGSCGARKNLLCVNDFVVQNSFTVKSSVTSTIPSRVTDLMTDKRGDVHFFDCLFFQLVREVVSHHLFFIC